MARIPIYTQQTQAPGGVSLGNLRVPDMNADAIGRGLQQVGQSMGQIAQMQIKVEEENAKVEANNFLANSELEWKAKLVEYQQTAKPGAQGFTKDISKDFGTWAEESLKNITNPRARKLLADNMSGLKRSVLNTAITYEASEGIAFRFNAQKDTNLKLGQAIMLDPSETNLVRLMDQGMSGIDSLQMPDSKRQQLKDDLRVTLGRSGAEAMVKDQPVVLLAQIDAAKKRGDKKSSGNAYLDLLPATEWDTYIKAAQSNNDAVAVEANANTVWAKLGPQRDMDPVNVDLMRKEIDAQMSDRTPAERKAAYAFIDDKARVHNFSANERNTAKVANVWNLVLANRPLSEITRSPEYRELDGTSRIKILSEIESYRKKGVDDVSQMAAYLKLTSDPAQLANMTTNEIIAQAPRLGDTLTKDLLKRHQSLNDPANVIEARIDEDTFKRLADEAGLKPYAPGKTEKENASLGRLKYAIVQKIDVEQQVLKRKLSPQEKENLVRKELDNKVMVEAFGRDKSMIIGLVEKDKLGDTYVVVQGTEVKLNSIPAESRSRAIRQLRAFGQPITEQAIAELYIQFRKQPSSNVEQIPR
jgi:hypothetical protein